VLVRAFIFLFITIKIDDARMAAKSEKQLGWKETRMADMKTNLLTLQNIEKKKHN